MFKKFAIAAVAVLLVGGLLFGRNMVPYATTAFDKIKQRVNDSVPIEHQIDAAEKHLKKIDPEVRRMRHEIAKEKVAINRETEKVVRMKDKLEDQYAHIMRLRDHLETGDSHYVTKKHAYSNETVKKELSNAFKNYKTGKSTVEKVEKVLELRRQGLTAAVEKMNETIAQQKELEIEIANLRAQLEMVEVAKTANKINIDDSQLSRTREMMDNISARIEVENEVLELIPNSPGIIPMEDAESTFDGDIVDEIDTYFQKESTDEVVSK